MEGFDCQAAAKQQPIALSNEADAVQKIGAGSGHTGHHIHSQSKQQILQQKKPCLQPTQGVNF